MRQNLGRVLSTVLLLTVSMLYADTPYTWSLKSNKSSAYVNEAVAIEYICDFKDEAYLYAIELHLEGESEEHRILSLGMLENTKDGKRQSIYRYVLFPKTPGQKEFAFNVLMRKTTKDSIENSVIGRDNVEDYAFSDKTVALPSVNLEVLDHKERMTGQFDLEVILDKNDVKAYEPVHLDISVRGEGDFDQIQDFELAISGVKIFSEPGEKQYKLAREGFKGEWSQKFSLVGNKNFRIDPIELVYFDIVKKERVVLHSEAFDVAVQEGYKREELLDAVDEKEDYGWWSWSYLYYLLAFISGVLTGRFIPQYKRVKNVPKGFKEEVGGCRSVKKLLTKLVMSGDRRYAPLIEKYEALGANASLKALKKELKQLLQSDINA